MINKKILFYFVAVSCFMYNTNTFSKFVTSKQCAVSDKGEKPSQTPTCSGNT